MVVFTDKKDMIEFVNEKRKVKTNQVYQHFKGGLYIIENVARHSETNEEIVVYRSLKTGDLWARPKSMFMDIKQTEEGYTYRFSQYHFD